MNDLIKIQPQTIGGQTIETVNARDLHAFLEVGKVFAAWIQERIAQYGFVEHHDFAVFSDSGKNPSGGRPAKEYAISLDMAKELAMVERNDKGRQARQYFIECERRLKQQTTPAMLSPVESDLRGVAFIADSMRLPESGKLDMFTRYCQANAPQLLPALPAYAVDKPSDSRGDSSQPTLPISKIVDGITQCA